MRPTEPNCDLLHIPQNPLLPVCLDWLVELSKFLDHQQKDVDAGMSLFSDTVKSKPAPRYRVAAENAVGVGPFIESLPVAADVKPEFSSKDTSKSVTVIPEGKDGSIVLSFAG